MPRSSPMTINSIEPIVKNTISPINQASTRRNPTLRTSRNTKHTAPVQKGICAPFQRTPLGWKVDLVPPLSCPTTVYGIRESDLRDETRIRRNRYDRNSNRIESIFKNTIHPANNMPMRRKQLPSLMKHQTYSPSTRRECRPFHIHPMMENEPGGFIFLPDNSLQQWRLTITR
ncbi:hypothetical protein, variant 2 [Blastomyces gilchristii SLH14081]|uniref:Uncharacterized protein n=1 Tax=Blastomyces gilchristii (strain SLH14081) TaxID=559298 RepID=A0A179URS2_BLAGS|nr:uncharacterized protein BDBG_05454 [Blastomyces gilchristii SLH14081]XP_031578981.1 hypothetical protein, variant 1 [Blastomyces gilchristii SLH14081]XP_031578982.1 hypothetical protein, variant 2 [Blastomyces gilchristii SLH14081]EQL38002.1 hypothetical protein BDFG_00409 [Blastomyces dermatitidis ATCC 26199]OAT09730.1 hypothetical protein BDBG_05454 [Blastomyces gilchristii SLH14081]OAT09731.1 hypothetical protein, variant 1 [Blastomyces gilchristii SLH14081]OAT09732.1 hypothetical prote